ncbi:MAG: type II secretion system protein GspG [Candidatus Krumholzibacteriia bacterium]
MPRASRRTPRPGGRAGFTLIEVIVAVAIVAVLAGAITPMVFRELMQAREEATERELAAISTGLVDFYTDTGRLPTEAEGLGALVNDPGAAGWQGPYVKSDRGNPVTEASTDGFNNAYIYDLGPATVPAGAADAVVVSAGADGIVASGAPGGTWQLAGVGDDLVQAITTGPVDRTKLAEAQAEVMALATAIRAYYADHTAFPGSVAVLIPDYMDQGVAGGALIDPWNQGYLVSAAPAGGAVINLTIRSTGPNRTDEGGAGDDVAVVVSNISLGREISTWKQDTAQAAINNSGHVLVGAWPANRAALGLPATFDVDGWGQPFLVLAGANMVYSAGPDGVAGAVLDNVPAGVGP